MNLPGRQSTPSGPAEAGEPWRVLVTGPRHWQDGNAIYHALYRIQMTHPGRRFEMINGQCDPRAAGRVIPWDTAVNLLPGWQQRNLAGFDWLSYLAGRQLGWDVRLFPAGWSQGKGGGPARNRHMVWKISADEAVAGRSRCVTPACRRRGWHMTHGTANCVTELEKSSIPVTFLEAL